MERIPITSLHIDALLPSVLGNGIQIYWTVDKEFCNHDLKFAVLFSKSLNGPFAKLANTETNSYIDSVNTIRGKNRELYYAVATKDNTTGKTYKSPVQRVGEQWSKRDWLLARDITRKESLRLKRFCTRGWLLKRKHYGDTCSCVNERTGKVEDALCTECYGTGIVGGYHSPIEAWVDQNPDKLVSKVTEEGPLHETVTTWRVLAYPEFYPNDVWVDGSSGDRYRVQAKRQTVGHISGVPIVMQIMTSLEYRSDIVYSVEVNDRG